MSTPATRPRWSLRGVAEAALWVGLAGGFGLCLLTLAAFAGERHWLLEITTHFRPHYALGLLVFAAAYAWGRRFRLSAVFAVFAVANVVVLLPRFAPHATAPVGAPQLKLLLSNVHTPNRDYPALLNLIAREQPDVVVLMEVNDTWIAALAPLEKTHPFTRKVSRSDNFGIALYSRLPLNDVRTLYLSPAEVPSIRATVSLGDDRPITLLATHPLPPGDAENTMLRDLQLGAIARWSASATAPAVVTRLSPVASRRSPDRHRPGDHAHVARRTVDLAHPARSLPRHIRPRRKGAPGRPEHRIRSLPDHRHRRVSSARSLTRSS